MEDKYIPPKSAQEAAKKVLRWKEEHGDEVKAMTRIGWIRARQLANGDALSEDIVRRMANFYRHKKNAEIAPEHKNKPWKDNGYVAWLGWGGDTGIEWARRIVKKMDTKKASVINIVRELHRVARLIASKVIVDDDTVRSDLQEEKSNLEYSLREQHEENTEPFDLQKWSRRLDDALESISNKTEVHYLNRLVKTQLKQIEDDLNEPAKMRRVRSELSDIVGKLSKQVQYDGKTYLFELLRYVYDLMDYIDANTDKKDIEQQIRDAKDYLDEQYEKGMKSVQKVVRIIQTYLQKTGTSTTITIKPYPSQNEYNHLDFGNMNYDVRVGKGSSSPGFTLFDSGSTYDVDDVLDVGDADFFTGEEDTTYFGLVEYFRTGHLPTKKTGYIRLYRGMSDDEYTAWHSGAVIPRGKFFTSNRSSALSQDVSGQFPELYTFNVDARIVFETTKGTFQLAKDAKLRGNKIVAA